jgi:hypothetical protein
MIAKVLLVDDCPPPVTVCTPHLTLRDLPFEGAERALAPGEPDHPTPFLTDMIEVEHDWVRFAAVDTRLTL